EGAIDFIGVASSTASAIRLLSLWSGSWSWVWVWSGSGSWVWSQVCTVGGVHINISSHQTVYHSSPFHFYAKHIIRSCAGRSDAGHDQISCKKGGAGDYCAAHHLIH